MGFWSPEAKIFLESQDRTDLIHSGEAKAKEVYNLIREAQKRLDQWAEQGDLYDNKGGQSLLGDISGYEKFVGTRLVKELDALKNLMNTFYDLSNN